MCFFCLVDQLGELLWPDTQASIKETLGVGYDSNNISAKLFSFQSYGEERRELMTGTQKKAVCYVKICFLLIGF